MKITDPNFPDHILSVKDRHFRRKGLVKYFIATIPTVNDGVKLPKESILQILFYNLLGDISTIRKWGKHLEGEFQQMQKNSDSYPWTHGIDKDSGMKWMLLLCRVGYVISIYEKSLKNPDEEDDKDEEKDQKNWSNTDRMAFYLENNVFFDWAPSYATTIVKKANDQNAALFEEVGQWKNEEPSKTKKK
ncbi:hypothetical protein N0V90_002073 [Kalmusia sp. IMI 367209]|nr:hypothetical protein N0V90_002073 [Kalmusia sp. IMI 367209]